MSRRPCPRERPRAWGACGVVLLLLATVLAGCASSRSAADLAEARSKVVGVWEYRTNGTTLLQEGTLRISIVDGRLVGRLRDSWRGEVTARVTLYGPRMELHLDRARISGRLHSGWFEAAIRRDFAEMSVSPTRRRSAGSFVAQRIRTTPATDGRDRYGCPSLLREGSFLCSPFQAE